MNKDEDMESYWCYRCFGEPEYCKKCEKIKKFNELKEQYAKLNYKVGDKVKVSQNKKPFKITACNKRFIIATKPYNPKRTFLYTIIDFKNLVRGADNYGCLHKYDDKKEAKEALEELMQADNLDADLHVSYRNFVKLLDLEIIRGEDE